MIAAIVLAALVASDAKFSMIPTRPVNSDTISISTGVVQDVIVETSPTTLVELVLKSDTGSLEHYLLANDIWANGTNIRCFPWLFDSTINPGTPVCSLASLHLVAHRTRLALLWWPAKGPLAGPDLRATDSFIEIP